MQTYMVVKGDSLWLIARKFGITLEELVRANPQIKDPNKIFPGQRVNIPLPSQGGKHVYTVQPGDTMWLIAKKFGISLDTLLKANPQVVNADRIDVGQKIFIPSSGGSGGSGGGSTTGTYTVQSGDTLWLIAKRFGISLNELIAMNPQIKNPDLIFPGQTIHVPASGSQPPTPPPVSPGGENNGRLYFVKSGDTFFNIAQRYALNLESLILANPQIKNPDEIMVGMQLYLPGYHYVKSGETLFTIARKYGVDLNTLIAINPQIQNPDMIDVGQKVAIPRRSNGDMAIYTVKPGDSLFKIGQKYNLTVDSIVNANPSIENPDLIFPNQRLRIPGPHQVQKGQTLWEIASLYGISLEALLRANPQIEDENMIYPDTMVIIPSQRRGDEENRSMVGVVYIVQPGDTLYEIAKRYHVSLEALLQANPQISNADMIFPGQRVMIPVGDTECTCYMVKEGDTLYKIARMYGVKMEAIIASNPQIQNPNHIEAGWNLMIPLRAKPCRNEKSLDEDRAPTSHPQIYTVQQGDSLFSIAQKYKVTVKQILMANPSIKDENMIFPGEQLIILPADMVCEYRCLDCPWFTNRE